MNETRFNERTNERTNERYLHGIVLSTEIAWNT